MCSMVHIHILADGFSPCRFSGAGGRVAFTGKRTRSAGKQGIFQSLPSVANGVILIVIEPLGFGFRVGCPDRWSPMQNTLRAPRKTSPAGFSRCPAGLVYWGKGYKSTAYDTSDHVPSPKPPSR